MKRISVILIVLICAGCETIAGFGRDVTRTAETVDRALR